MLENIQLSKANQSNLLVLFKMFECRYIIFQGFICLWTKDFR